MSVPVSVVVKLGGSLAEAGSIDRWLAVAVAAGGRCVVVPGGGDFADAVRRAQRDYGFSDHAAHRMALAAMHQYAFLLADRAPALVPCAGEAEIAAVLARGGVPVWLPAPMVEADPAIAASWEVTSDSLAAWLARRLGARRLVLVKSVAPPPPPLTARRLAEAGVVDPAFPAYVEGAGFALTWCGPGDEGRLAAEIRLG